MKKVSLISGIGILALSLVSFVGSGECEKSKEAQKVGTVLTELQEPFINALLAQNENGVMCVEDIVFIETDEEIDLGFDTAEYLPIGFDAYAGMELVLDEISFLETEEEIDLGFDTAEYLPKGFNPYKGMEHENLKTETQIDFHLESYSK